MLGKSIQLHSRSPGLCRANHERSLQMKALKILLRIVIAASMVCVFGGFVFIATGHKVSPYLHSTAKALAPHETYQATLDELSAITRNALRPVGQVSDPPKHSGHVSDPDKPNT
jgi:hypothetical protein